MASSWSAARKLSQSGDMPRSTKSCKLAPQNRQRPASRTAAIEVIDGRTTSIFGPRVLELVAATPLGTLLSNRLFPHWANFAVRGKGLNETGTIGGAYGEDAGSNARGGAAASRGASRSDRQAVSHASRARAVPSRSIVPGLHGGRASRRVAAWLGRREKDDLRGAAPRRLRRRGDRARLLEYASAGTG